MEYLLSNRITEQKIAAPVIQNDHADKLPKSVDLCSDCNSLMSCRPHGCSKMLRLIQLNIVIGRNLENTGYDKAGRA